MINNAAKQLEAEGAQRREDRKRVGTFKQAPFADKVPGYLVFTATRISLRAIQGRRKRIGARKEDVDRVRVTGSNTDNLEVRFKWQERLPPPPVVACFSSVRGDLAVHGEYG